MRLDLKLGACLRLALSVLFVFYSSGCSKIQMGGARSQEAPMHFEQAHSAIEMIYSAYSVATHGQGQSEAHQPLVISDSSFIEPRAEFRIELDAAGGFDPGSLSLGLAEVFRSGSEGAVGAILRLSNHRLIIESPILFEAPSAQLCVRISGLRSASGDPYQATRIALGRLFTDVDNTGIVEQQDWKTLNQYYSSDPTSAMALPGLIRSDINLDGQINAADQTQALANQGLELPAGDPASLCN